MARKSLIPVDTEHGMALVNEDYLRERTRIEDELLTIGDLVELTKFSPTKVRRMIHDGEIPAFKVGGDWRITRREYRRAAANQFKTRRAA